MCVLVYLLSLFFEFHSTTEYREDVVLVMRFKSSSSKDFAGVTTLNNDSVKNKNREKKHGDKEGRVA